MIRSEFTDLPPGKFAPRSPFLVVSNSLPTAAITYNCVDGECVGAGDAGEYATLADCEANCRCPSADCDNQPDTMSLSFAITGTFPTSDVCNEAMDYMLDFSASSGEIDVTDQDGVDCSRYSVETDPIHFTSDCSSPDCNETFDVTMDASLTCFPDDGHWFLTLDIFGHTICNNLVDPWGGSPIFDPGMDLGTDPTGTHNLTFDDPNYSTIHYDVTVVIT